MSTRAKRLPLARDHCRAQGLIAVDLAADCE